ncbi:MAG: hypothetical protein QN178_15065 [Armatimonadota bacterium]|nr:hypothetical protein [Armatimonadota bacterium]
MPHTRVHVVRRVLHTLVAGAVCVGLTMGAGPGDAHAQPALIIRTTDNKFAAPAAVRAGFTTIEIVNDGADLHHAQMARLNPGVTTAQALGALRKGLGAFVPLVTFVGGPGLVTPRGRERISLTLLPGDYLLLCFVETNGVPHVASGMVKPLRVTGAVEAQPIEAAGGEITLHDFRIAFPRGFDGRSTYRVVNQGEQPHEAIFLKLAPGKTAEDVRAFFAQPHPAGQPPAVPMGGVQGLSRGGINYYRPNLPAGDYAVVCFIPDLTSGKPHIALGMINAVTMR